MRDCLDRPDRIGGWRSPILCRITELTAASAFEIGEREVASATRGSSQAALARQVAMYLAHVGCGLSLTEVGRLFGRDRTTVAHACAVVEDRRDEPSFDRAMSALEYAVRQLGAKLTGPSQ
jgi:chromosomal replication initiation ATPase DnaA